MNEIFTHKLHPRERADAIKIGMMLSLVAHGIPPVTLTKHAQTPVQDVSNLLFQTVPRGIVSVSLLTGIPIGIVSHMMDRAAAPEQQKQREALQKIKYYKDVGREMEGRLAESETTGV